MRVFIDTNVLVSASLGGAGVPHQALTKATAPPNRGVICDQNLEEIGRVYKRKFPNEMGVLTDFLASVLPDLEVVRTPAVVLGQEARIRDATDRPILRAAIMAGADVPVLRLSNKQVTPLTSVWVRAWKSYLMPSGGAHSLRSLASPTPPASAASARTCEDAPFSGCRCCAGYDMLNSRTRH